MRFSHADFGILLRYYKNYLPMIFYQLMPVGAMMATLFTLSAMNRNNEIVALFSMGMSLARISLPILILIGLISLLTFWMGDHLVPIFAQKRNYIFYVELKKRPGLYSVVRKNKIWYRSENMIYNIQTLNADKGTAQGITLYYLDDAWNLIQLIKAKSVTMQNKSWSLENGSVTLFDEESSFPLTKTFAKKNLVVNEDLADIRSSPPSSDSLSYKELKKFIQRNKDAGLDTLRLEVDMHAKISFAFAGLILSLMGIPFTVQKSRAGGNMFNIGVCILSAFVYWVVFSAFLSMGKNGLIPPLIAAWLPNLVVGSGATYLLLRLRK